MGMFDTYTSVTSAIQPDNRTKYLENKKKFKDTITRNATAYHYFEIPFANSDIMSLEITYKQSLDSIITIPDTQIIRDTELDNSTIVYVYLSKQETNLFVKDRDTFVQVRIILNDGQIIFSDPEAIRIKEPFEIIGEN